MVTSYGLEWVIILDYRSEPTESQRPLQVKEGGRRVGAGGILTAAEGSLEQDPRSWNSKDTDCPPAPPDGMQPCQLIVDFLPLEVEEKNCVV